MNDHTDERDLTWPAMAGEVMTPQEVLARLDNEERVRLDYTAAR